MITSHPDGSKEGQSQTKCWTSSYIFRGRLYLPEKASKWPKVNTKPETKSMESSIRVKVRPFYNINLIAFYKTALTKTK